VPAFQIEGAFETMLGNEISQRLSQKKLVIHNFRLICVNAGLFERVHAFTA